MNYKDSGVDIEAGNEFVKKLKKKAPSIGGFSGMFKVPRGYEEPVLVSGADGVGTKINMAHIARDYTTIGIDLVAMCVNDVICCGAKPLYFLDYISCEKLDDRANEIVEGIIKGCEMSGCELLGGETAEHGRFSKDYDLAGFCTGIVEKNEIIDGSLIRKGDKIIGLPSSGLHSNGYSLINDMLWRHKITFNHSYIGKPMPELLTPTTIYARQIEMLLNEIPIVGMAHITGGGLEENISRVIPNGLKAQIDWSSWERPDVFNKIKIAGDVEEQEMRKVFNCGIGFCLIVPSEIDYGLQIGEVV
jgi:phosphoribosylformylglycinamidine cyclo-ligase